MCLSFANLGKDTMLATMYEGVDEEKRKSLVKSIEVSEEHMFAFSEEVYLSAPIGAIPRVQREQVLDATSQWISTAKDNNVNLVKHISLMVKLMEAPNATAKIVRSLDYNAVGVANWR